MQFAGIDDSITKYRQLAYDYAMAKIDIIRSVRDWDRQRNEQPDLTGVDVAGQPADEGRSYKNLLEKIRFLTALGFDEFDGPIRGAFEERISEWLGQMTDAEQRIMFVACSSILMITRKQMRSIQRYLYTRKVRQLLLDDIIAERKLPRFRYDIATTFFDEKLDQCLFVPLTDSADIRSFFHINLDDLSQSDSRKLTGPPVGTLIEPSQILRSVKREIAGTDGSGVLPSEKADKLANAAEHINWYRDKLSSKYLSNKTHLLILEDFSGSGNTAAASIRDLVRDYPNLERIVFCPYVCTADTMRCFDDLGEQLSDIDRPKVVILEGIVLPEEAKALHPDSYLWKEHDLPLSQEELRSTLLSICNKYFQSHHHRENDRYKAKTSSMQIGPLGFKDGQLMLVLFSNCPNNSLPIIWSTSGVSDRWVPLFERVPRY